MAQTYSRQQLIALAAADARKYGIGDWFTRQISQESGFNPAARSGAGAVGIAQIVPKYHPGVNPDDPVAALDWAAKYDAGLVHKYGGNVAQALSVYNSGRPDAYKDPAFAGGQTYRYVRNILGATPPARAGSTSQPAASPLAAAAAGTRDYMAPVREALTTAEQGGALDRTRFYETLRHARSQAAQGVPAMPLPAGTGQTVPATPLPFTKGDRLAAVPLALATRQGIQLDQQVLPQADQIAQQFGVRINSGYRSAAHNAQVGGANNSDHLSGDAVDFTGNPRQLAALYQWALTQRFPYVEPMQHAKDHVHISLRRGGR